MDFRLTAEQEALQARARELAQGDFAARAPEIDRSEQYPWDNVEALREAGFFGMTIPPEHGGQGRSYLDVTLAIEEFAKVCGASGRIVVEANMGAIGAIMAYGSDEQRKLAAGLVLAGDKPAICITEPGAGSAATEMTTRAERVGNRWIVNGKKHWITGGGVSRLHLVFARVYEDGEAQGIGGFIAVRDETPGLRIGARIPAMGLRGIPETEILFEDMEVAPAMMVMPPRGLKRGFADLMNAYNGQRVGAGTVALGLAQGAFERALDFSQEREQFGRPIAEFQGLHWMLADMSVQIDAARLLLHRAAASAETTGTGFPDPTAAAQAKIHASEMAIEVTNDALQVWGAAGYSRDNPMERYVRDARMFAIAGGTAQILRTLVAARLLGRKLPQTRDGYVREEKAR
jgi:alkylation response protein AidB-like acyl-CoA dehydrogenase